MAVTSPLLLVSHAGTTGRGSRQPFSSALAPTHPSFLPSYRLQLLLAISSFTFLEHASILMFFSSKAGNEAAGSLLAPFFPPLAPDHHQDHHCRKNL